MRVAQYYTLHTLKAAKHGSPIPGNHHIPFKPEHATCARIHVYVRCIHIYIYIYIYVLHIYIHIYIYVLHIYIYTHIYV